MCFRVPACACAILLLQVYHAHERQVRAEAVRAERWAADAADQILADTSTPQQSAAADAELAAARRCPRPPLVAEMVEDLTLVILRAGSDSGEQDSIF